MTGPLSSLQHTERRSSTVRQWSTECLRGSTWWGLPLSTRSDRLRLRAARKSYLGREGAPTSGDRWFSLYLIAFAVGSYIVPVAYATGQFLDTELAALLVSPASELYVFAGLTVLAVVFLWAGQVQVARSESWKR